MDLINNNISRDVQEENANRLHRVYILCVYIYMYIYISNTVDGE